MTYEEVEKASPNDLALLFLKENPNATKAKCTFSGSGDCFDDFYDITVFGKDDSEMEYNADDTLQQLFFKIIDTDGRAIFDNDGSCGEIDIDFITGKIKIEVSYYETIKNSDGENEYDNIIDPKMPDKPIQDLSNFVKLKNKKKAK